jgi:ssDNA-binding Zn-finger/Zn-ribbon topoisomerase 1
MKPVYGFGLGAFGLCAGLAVASGGFANDTAKLISLLAVGALPASFVTYLAADTRAQRLINEAENKTKKAGETLHKVIRDFDNCKSKLATLNSQLEALKDELKEARNTINSLGHAKIESSVMAAHLNSKLDEYQAKITQLLTHSQKDKQRIEYLESEVEQWEVNFKSAVDAEANKRFQLAKQTELEKIYSEHDSITSEAMQLFRRLQNWGEKVAHGHASKAEIIKSLASGYNQNLDEVSQAINAERQSYLEQIELLNIRIGQLQQQLAGDLIEPVYGEFGFDANGRIANAIAQWLWFQKQIPLKVTGIEVTEEVVTVGYFYSQSISPDALAKLIKDCSSEITRSLGIYSIESAKKLAVTDCLVVKFRRDRPARKTDKGSLYRSQQDFINYLLSQPIRWRIVGEPGAGKTPTVLVLMSHIFKRGFLTGNTPNGKKLDLTEIAFCNPLAGISVKNSTDLDFCLRWQSASQGFQGLANEYQFRKSLTNSQYKDSVGYIWVCDEFDNAIDTVGNDGGKQFKQVLKDGGHINMGVIIMGQSGMVASTKGLTIDDQKMLTNVYIDPVSIRTFLTQYGDRFYSKSTVEKALLTLEQIELEIEEQNQTICDTAREFRIAMVVADRSPVFYQLPYFDNVDIDLDGYQESLAKIEALRKAKSSVTVLTCPQCQSQSIKKNGKSQGKQRYSCRDCGKNWLEG